MNENYCTSMLCIKGGIRSNKVNLNLNLYYIDGLIKLSGVS